MTAWIQIAAICQGFDATTTTIYTAASAVVAPKPPPIQIDATIVVVVQADRPGRHRVQWTVRSPTGRSATSPSQPVEVKRAGAPAIMAGPFELEADEIGLWWVEVRLDGEPRTRIALEIQQGQPPVTLRQ